MNRPKASDFAPEVLSLFDRYVHGGLTRREFLDRAAKFAGGVSAAALLPQYAGAQQIAPDDPRLSTEYVSYPSPRGHDVTRGYLARPANAGGRLPAILVIHENRGLNPYVEDVVRRAAIAGFLAFGPDALAPSGGYPGNDDDGRRMQSELDRARVTEDFVAAAEFLMNHPESTGRVGAVGFCFGGGMVSTLAVRLPNLAAGVPFYGSQPSAADVPKINAPLMMQYAELDTRINNGWPAFEEALRANGKTFTMHMYPQTNHGFHNDSTPRYDEAAAALAWERTIAFFNEHLRS